MSKLMANWYNLEDKQLEEYALGTGRQEGPRCRYSWELEVGGRNVKPTDTLLRVLEGPGERGHEDRACFLPGWTGACD